MPEPEVTGATEDDTELTPEEEPVVPESGNQNSSTRQEDIEANIRKLQEELEENRKSLKKEARRREEAEAKFAEEERKYKGLQRSTQDKLNELAQLKRLLENQTITKSRLEYMEKLLDKIAEQQLSPEDRDKLREEIKQEQLRQENETLRQESQSRQQQQQFQVPDLRDPEYRKQVKQAYFSDFKDVDALDLTLGGPNDEWATDSNDPNDWYMRVRANFARRQQTFEDSQKKAKKEKSSEEIEAKISAKLQEQLDAIQQDSAKKLAELSQTNQQLQSELAEAKRLAEEAANRAKGMDRVDRTQSGGPTTNKVNRLMNDIPEDWLYGTQEQRDAYRKAMNDKGLRDQIIQGLGTR